jgi:acetyl/propionyl-CoA carboxylase alpha subunit
VGREVHEVDLRMESGRLRGTADGAAVDAAASSDAPGDVTVEVGGRRFLAVVVRTPTRALVSIAGVVFEVSRTGAGAADAPAAPAVEPFAASPMTGVLSKVHVAPGASVEAGAPLFAVEAMKMEYVVRADRAVTVAEVRRGKGDRVSIGEVVVTYAARGG